MSPEVAESEPPDRGYAVLREGKVAGALRPYEPEWVEVMNVVAVLAQSPESLAAVLDLVGPTTQEKVGEILGLAVEKGELSGARGEEGEPRG